jgi:hypothetical protein
LRERLQALSVSSFLMMLRDVGHSDLWLKGVDSYGRAGDVVGPSTAARNMLRAFAEDDEFVWGWKRAVRAFARMPT